MVQTKTPAQKKAELLELDAKISVETDPKKRMALYRRKWAIANYERVLYLAREGGRRRRLEKWYKDRWDSDAEQQWNDHIKKMKEESSTAKGHGKCLSPKKYPRNREV